MIWSFVIMNLIIKQALICRTEDDPGCATATATSTVVPSSTFLFLNTGENKNYFAFFYYWLLLKKVNMRQAPVCNCLLFVTAAVLTGRLQTSHCSWSTQLLQQRWYIHIAAQALFEESEFIARYTWKILNPHSAIEQCTIRMKITWCYPSIYWEECDVISFYCFFSSVIVICRLPSILISKDITITLV